MSVAKRQYILMGFPGPSTPFAYLRVLHSDFLTQIQLIQLENPEAYAKFITKDLPDQLNSLALFAVG